MLAGSNSPLQDKDPYQGDAAVVGSEPADPEGNVVIKLTVVILTLQLHQLTILLIT